MTALKLRNARVSYATTLGVKSASRLKRDALESSINREEIIAEVVSSQISVYVGQHRAV